MNRSLILLISLLSVIVSVNCLAPWTPIDWQTIPPASPSDKVEVLYLMSPLLEEDFGNILEYFSLYHGAIAFVNNATGLEITINYDAFNLFKSSVFPDIVTYPNGTTDLVWLDGGASFIYYGINETYWTAGQFLITTINGTQFNMFLSDYNSQVNITHPYYNAMAITDGYGEKPWIPSWDCFDFVWEAMGYLSSIGAQFNESLQLNRDYASVYSSEPMDYTDLYETDPQIREEINQFYEFTEAAFKNMTLSEIVESFYEIFGGNFFVRSSARYWKAKIHYPYFGIDLEYTPYPNSTNSWW